MGQYCITVNERLAVIVPVYNEPRIRVTLDALYNQSHQNDTHHYVVDNGSTDETRTKIEEFVRRRDDFPLTILTENQKGTGAAADTGFRHAISDGFNVLARTDGDSAPMPTWTKRIVETFESLPNMRLLGGRMTALRDEQYRMGDDQLLRAAVFGARTVLALKHLDPNYLKIVTGANMATRACAYEQVGGMPRSSIDELDEDIHYSIKIAREFGQRAIRHDSTLLVATSMRRIRALGVVGTSIHHLFPGTRNGLNHTIDIRNEY